MMKKFKLFLDNIMFYGVGGIINKIIPFIMIPVILNIMPSADYFGISDMFNMVVEFGASIALFGMYDALFRMFFEKDDLLYKKSVCSTALTFVSFSSAVLGLLVLEMRLLISKLFFNNSGYADLVALSSVAMLASAVNTILYAPTRMQNNKKIFLLVNCLTSILSFVIAIPLLLRGHYIYALPIGFLITALTFMLISYCINRKWFELKMFDINLLKQLFTIAVPLLPNFLVYWVFHAFDRLMITNLLGLAEVGVYSVGSKIGQISQLVYVSFAGGWQYFAFSTMKDKGQVKLNSLIFEYMGVISYVATAFICLFSNQIFKWIFKPDYLLGYIVSPYLFFAPLLQMLYQIASNQFLVVKKTWPNLLILLFGAVINVCMNYMLIPMLGIEGAAIATLMGYVSSVVLCVMILRYLNQICISIRFIISTLLMILYFVMWRFVFGESFVLGLPFALAFIFVVLLQYKRDIKKCLLMINDLYLKRY